MRYNLLFRSFERRLTPTMRQHHVAGDKVYCVHEADDAETMVTFACAIMLSSSIVSTRSEFQIIERSVTLMSGISSAMASPGSCTNAIPPQRLMADRPAATLRWM